MVSKVLGTTLAIGLCAGAALPAQAQMRTSRPTGSMMTPATEIQPVVGPTRLFIIPRGDTLPSGESITSLNLLVSTTNPAQVTPGLGIPAPSSPGLGLGFGYGGNALSITNQSAMGPVFELDTGLTAYATTPWQGRLDLAAKLGLLQEKLGGLANLAGIAGVALNLDANGTPTLGFTVGVPVSKTLGFTPMNRLTLAVYPNWGTGLVAPGVVGAGIIPATRFALGVGGAFTLTDTIALIADTSWLPVAGATGVPTEGTNLGLRFGMSPNVTFDLFGSMSPAGIGVSTTPVSIGAGMNWQY